ncbi:unnamed protein product [Paramecium sonneborni]|uniref:Uncharacterized protein n=1 Tax=Paramecium sonneborni TaxID=65129 RepID=A0A8S1PHB3_9CILI|nr:unnamed protein product [Paramecium sonneborni]
MANIPQQQYSTPSNLPSYNRDQSTYQQPTLGQQQVPQGNYQGQPSGEKGLQYLPQQAVGQPQNVQTQQLYGLPQQGLIGQPQTGLIGQPQLGMVGQPQIGLVGQQQAIQQPLFGQSQIQQLQQQTVETQQGQVVKGQSRIEYIPYERTVTEYEEVRRQVQVPITKQVTDYYAVQYDIEYIPQVVQEKQIEYVPVERFAERTEYYTVERQNIIQQPIGYQSSQVQTSTAYTPVQTQQLTQQYTQYVQPQQTVAYQQPLQIQQQYQTREVIQQPVVQQSYVQQREIITQPQVQQQVALQPTIPTTQYLPSQQYQTIQTAQPQLQIAQTVPLNYAQSIQTVQTPQQQATVNPPQQTVNSISQGYSIPMTSAQAPQYSLYGQQSLGPQQTKPQQTLTQTTQYNPQLQQTVAPSQFAQSAPQQQQQQQQQQQSIPQDMGRTRPYQQGQLPQQPSQPQQTGTAQKSNKEKSFLEKLFD